MNEKRKSFPRLDEPFLSRRIIVICHSVRRRVACNDLQEVTLRKTGSAEKLGLTVCYSSGSGSEDADTEVYISEIVPESLAARDGRLREGDQILRVSCEDRGLRIGGGGRVNSITTLRTQNERTNSLSSRFPSNLLPF